MSTRKYAVGITVCLDMSLALENRPNHRTNSQSDAKDSCPAAQIVQIVQSKWVGSQSSIPFDVGLDFALTLQSIYVRDAVLARHACSNTPEHNVPVLTTVNH